MAIKYEDLQYKEDGKTVVNKTSGKEYSDPTAIANDYGDNAANIDWTKIAKSTGATAGASAAQTATPSPVVTSTAARSAETDNAKSYVRYAGEDKVFNKATGSYVPYEEAVAKNIWNDIQDSTEARPSNITTPVENIQKVFGADWKPSVSTELQAQGILGAVRIGNQVYTIGSGGHPVGAEEYKSLFKTDSQDGIVGQISLDQAVGLGITPTQDDISSFNSKLIENMYTVTSLGDLATKQEEITKKAYAEADKTQKEIKDNYAKVISLYENFQTEKTKAKDEESKKLGLEEKSKAISEAQTVCNNLSNKYLTFINSLASSTMTTAHIGGMQAQARAQMATELAPLQTAITIAEGNYDRAKTMLDEFSADYNTNFEMLLNGYQANIDMLGSELNYEQSKAKTEAENKLALLNQSYTEMRETQEQVKDLAMIYNAQGAGITISDNWETAYRKAAPYIKSEQDLEKEIANLDIQYKKAQINTEYAQAGAAGRSNRGSTEKEKELTGLEGALNEAAKDVIAAENVGAPMSSESYWTMVKQFSEAMGVTEADADRQIMNTVKAKKGEANNANTNMGSDFIDEADIMKSIASKPAIWTTDEGLAKKAQDSYVDELKQKASALIATYSNSPYSPEGIKAKNQLNSIPRTYQGITIHSGV